MSENSYNNENTIDVDFGVMSEVDVQVGTVYQSGASTLADLSDVNLTSPTNNQSLIYDSENNRWVNGTISGGASALEDLSDVDIASGSLGTNQVLMYDGGTGKWWNNVISMSGGGGSGNISDVHATTPSNNEVLMWDSTYDDWENKSIRIGNAYDEGNISDVTVDNNTLSNKDVLIYDYSNSQWKNGVLFRDLYGTLSASSTSVTITNTYSDITIANASLEVYTDIFGVNPTNITISGNIITLTFEEQSSAVNIKVRLWK